MTAGPFTLPDPPSSSLSQHAQRSALASRPGSRYLWLLSFDMVPVAWQLVSYEVEGNV